MSQQPDQRDSVQVHPAVAAILRFFEYDHLPEPQQQVSRLFYTLAHTGAQTLEGPELTAGLRRLLEAKDCFVRASL